MQDAERVAEREFRHGGQELPRVNCFWERRIGEGPCQSAKTHVRQHGDSSKYASGGGLLF